MGQFELRPIDRRERERRAQKVLVGVRYSSRNTGLIADRMNSADDGVVADILNALLV